MIMLDIVKLQLVDHLGLLPLACSVWSVKPEKVINLLNW